MLCPKRLKCYVRRDEKEYYIKFEKGIPTVELKEIGTSEETGTKVRFKADPEIFKNPQFSNMIFLPIVFVNLPI